MIDTNFAISIIGGIQACFAAGAAFGAITQGWLSDWLGRKKAIAVAGSWALVGGALTTASVNIAMLITMRVLHGFGFGMIICLVPLYITEVVSANLPNEEVSGLHISSASLEEHCELTAPAP